MTAPNMQDHHLTVAQDIAVEDEVKVEEWGEYLSLFDLSPLLQTWFCYWEKAMRREWLRRFDCCVAARVSLCCERILLVWRRDSACIAEGFFLCRGRSQERAETDGATLAPRAYLSPQNT